jgi:hypothetical protein
MAGHYEVHDYPAAGHGLKVIVWAEPGKAPLVMTTISPGRIAPLADALAEYLDRNPGDPGTG